MALFLLTKDGVRQVTVTLDFETTEFGDQQRLTYQYNSVVAAHVVDARNGEKALPDPDEQSPGRADDHW
ncbi:hypothetical protein [Micromonospora sp. NPDC048947]|uniref:hypothetical protein n=1 Tax=Micromonospora sp. NPDC048947 TaxID=3154826 RepID=UPI0033EB0768